MCVARLPATGSSSTCNSTFEIPRAPAGSVATLPVRSGDGRCHLQFIRSAVHLEPDIAFNSFSNPPFLQFIRSANALLLRPSDFSVLLAFLSLSGPALRAGGGDQRVKRTNFFAV